MPLGLLRPKWISLIGLGPDELGLFTPAADARRRPLAVIFVLYEVCTVTT